MTSLLENTVPLHIVYRYLVIIMNQIIPYQVWGSVGNQKHFNRLILKYISTPIKENLDLEYLCHGFVVDEFFLTISTQPNRYQSISFYLKPDWKSVSEIQLGILKNSIYRPISLVMSDQLKTRKFGVSSLRFIPKSSNMRPIVNPTKRSTRISVLNQSRSGITTVSFNQSINDSLSDFAYPILKFELSNRPKILGASIFSKNDFYQNLLKCQPMIRSLLAKKKHIYFLTIDINKCYDFLDQEKLLNILKGIFQSDSYIIQKISTVGNRKGNTTIQNKTFATSNPPSISFENTPHQSKLGVSTTTTTTTNKKIPTYTILLDKGGYKMITKENVKNIFHEHISNQLIQYQSELMQQVVGIPQGLICSPLLCCMVLGAMENEVLFKKLNINVHDINNNIDKNTTNQNYLKNEENDFNFINRFIDDYFLATTSLSKFQLFQDTLNQGIPGYGVKSNPSKSKYFISNDNQHGIQTRGDKQLISWCHYYINVETFEIHLNFSKYQLENILH
eukprot:gene2657-3297_t